MYIKQDDYYEDMYNTRMSIVEKLLKSFKPNTDYLHDFPFMIDKSKAGKLEEKEKSTYKQAYSNYRQILQTLFRHCVSEAIFKQTTIDLAPLYEFVFGGRIDTNTFADHVTNKCYTNLFTAVMAEGLIDWNYNYKERPFDEETLDKYNDFVGLKIKRTEYEYIQNKKTPSLVYMITALIFNTSFVEGDYSRFLNSDDTETKKYYIFVDLFGDKSHVVTLKLEKDSVYSNVFFHNYIDELMKDLKGSIDKLGNKNFIGRKKNDGLHDPSKMK